jgi:hypothetical protein
MPSISQRSSRFSETRAGKPIYVSGVGNYTLEDAISTYETKVTKEETLPSAGALAAGISNYYVARDQHYEAAQWAKKASCCHLSAGDYTDGIEELSAYLMLSGSAFFRNLASLFSRKDQSQEHN